MRTRTLDRLAVAVVTVLLAACSAPASENGPVSPVASSTAASAPVTTSGTPALPVPTSAPLAPGRNGLIIYSDKAGDIHSLDPRTGTSRIIVGGKHEDVGPGMLPDGRHFVFVRVDEDTLYTAAVDGTDITRWADARQRSNWDISPDGKRIAQIGEGRQQVLVYPAAGGKGRPVEGTPPVDSVSWAGPDLLLLVDEHEGSAVGMWTVRPDGSQLTALATHDVCCEGNTFAAGGLITWNSWPSGGHGTVHVMDAATRADAVLPSSDVPGSTFFGPHFSPDGRWITVSLFGGGEEGHQLALLASDGRGQALRLGPHLTENSSGFRTVFSPDARQVLAIYDDGTSWLFDLPSGTGGRTSWPSMLEATWQRLP